jgi:hypothetical protein
VSSERDNDDGRRRSHRNQRRLWMLGGGGAVLVLLLVNLGMSLPGLVSGETPGGFLADVFTAELGQHIGLWGALLPAAVAAVLGFRWAHEAFLRSERPAFLWLRRGFAVSLVTWGALIVVIMDDDVFDTRTSALIAAAALFSLNSIPFALAARAAAGARLGGRGPSGGNDTRRRRSRSSSEHREEADV